MSNFRGLFSSMTVSQHKGILHSLFKWYLKQHGGNVYEIMLRGKDCPVACVRSECNYAIRYADQGRQGGRELGERKTTAMEWEAY